MTPDASDAALPCPLCGYDLRGLPPGRCPECGHAFDPDELRRARALAASRPLPWLVEYGRGGPEAGHAPLPAWLLTPLAGLWPRRFWKALRPEMPVRRGRLLAYYAAATLLAVAGVLAAAAVQTSIAVAQDNYRYSSGFLVTRFGQEFPSSLARGGVLMLLVVTLWPPLSLVALMSLRASLRQARIRLEHPLRAVIYAGDVLLWAGPIFAVLAGLFGLTPQLRFLFEFNFYLETDDPAVLAAAVLLLLLAYRLAVAYRSYLRFPHATATVVATQLILALLLAVGLLNGADRFVSRLLF